jgi:DNA-binding winged helix-turn-helix (wHTH) protein
MPKTTLASAPNEIAKLLEEAAGRGHLVILQTAPPPDDARTRRLLTLNRLFGLTRAESRVFVEMLENNHISRETLGAAVFHDGGPIPKSKTLDVHISNLRAKLKPFGVELVTIRRLGFRLAEGAHDKINRLLAEHRAGSMTPAEPAAPPPD